MPTRPTTLRSAGARKKSLSGGHRASSRAAGRRCTRFSTLTSTRKSLIRAGPGGRPLGKVLAVDRVETGEVLPALEPDRRLHHVGERAARFPQRLPDQLDRRPCLLLDGPGGHRHPVTHRGPARSGTPDPRPAPPSTTTTGARPMTSGPPMISLGLTLMGMSPSANLRPPRRAAARRCPRGSAAPAARDRRVPPAGFLRRAGTGSAGGLRSVARGQAELLAPFRRAQHPALRALR